MPDLQDKLALVCELQDLVVLFGVAAKPDIVLVVDEYTVLGGEPFVSWPGTAPSLKKRSICVELQNRWSGDTTLCLWRLQCGGLFSVGNCCGSMKYPDIIVGIDRITAD